MFWIKHISFTFFSFLLYLSLSSSMAYGQCCSGASPIANSSTKAGLQKDQVQLNMNYQYLESDYTLTGSQEARFPMFEKVYASYLYYSIGYGLTENLSLFVENGYYINRTERLLGGFEITGQGISDLIIHPKYDVININNDKSLTELTLGLGSKIPIGNYNQEYIAFMNKSTGETIKLRKSAGIQPSTGTNDFIFSAFFYRSYFKNKISVRSNFTYLMRGTNPDGVNYGDIANLSFGLNKSYSNGLSFGLDLKVETLDTILDPVYFSYRYNSGGKKLSILPNINYLFRNNLTISVFSDFPIYQFVNGTQVAAEYLINFGILYRFYPSTKHKETESTKSS